MRPSSPSTQPLLKPSTAHPTSSFFPSASRGLSAVCLLTTGILITVHVVLGSNSRVSAEATIPPSPPRMVSSDDTRPIHNNNNNNAETDTESPLRFETPLQFKPPSNKSTIFRQNTLSGGQSLATGARSYTNYQQVPVGKPHNAFVDEIYPLYTYENSTDVDKATRLVEQQSIADEEAATRSRYDRPEDADELAKEGSIWHVLSRQYKNAPIEVLADNVNHTAMCLISAVYTGNCRYLDESFEECAARLGPSRFEAVLSEKCRTSRYWNTIMQNSNKYPRRVSASAEPLLHGLVPAAEICPNDRPDSVPYIPPSNRDVAPFGPPRHCRNGALEYPIAFGTPRANVQKKLLPKLFDFHPVPLDAGPKPFSFNDEDTYQALASMSHFCMTHSRGGWDCGRHYEVMGAGCVPYFYDIKAAGPYILPQLPKKLLMDIVSMPLFAHIGHAAGANGDHYDLPDSPYIRRDSFNGRTRVRFVKEGFRFKEGVQLDKAWYWRTARKLLRYTQKYLTSEAMAAYVLKTMGAEDAKRVLIVSRHEWDNLHQGLMTGLDGLGIETTVVVNKQTDKYGCFESGENGKNLTSADLCKLRADVHRWSVHAAGVPWANRMQSKKHRYVKTFREVEQGLSQGAFDAAIYTFFWPESVGSSEFLSAKVGTKGRVAVMDNNDTLEDPRSHSAVFAKESFYFSRELRRTFC